MSYSPEILEYLRPDLDEITFNEVAMELFRYQAKMNPVYREYLRQLQVKAENLTHWLEIPALPVAAYRRKRVACFPPTETIQVFHTSGTTEETTGKHEFASLEYYIRSLTLGFAGAMPDVSQYHWVSLIPSHEERPSASLSFMISTLDDQYAQGGVDFMCDKDFQFEPHEVFERLIEIALDGLPIFLLGTSFAFARLFESMMESRVRTSLPGDSIIFDTGGYKGREKAYSRQEFYSLIEECFEIKQQQIWNEYGMTELSAQAYTRCDVGLHQFPAWARAVVRNPATGEVCEPGELGVIQIIDLSNVGSVLAVSTLDAGIMHDKNQFEMVGRIDARELRGCSLNYE